MDSQEFLQELLDIVKDFCRTLDAQPPAYCYIPLKSDEERVRVMKSRLFNELRAAGRCTPVRGHAHGTLSRVSRQPRSVGNGKGTLVMKLRSSLFTSLHRTGPNIVTLMDGEN